MAYSTTAIVTSPVGSYPITATLTPAGSTSLSNYAITNTPGVLTITTATPTYALPTQTEVTASPSPSPSASMARSLAFPQPEPSALASARRLSALSLEHSPLTMSVMRRTVASPSAPTRSASITPVMRTTRPTPDRLHSLSLRRPSPSRSAMRPGPTAWPTPPSPAPSPARSALTPSPNLLHPRHHQLARRNLPHQRRCRRPRRPRTTPSRSSRHPHHHHGIGHPQRRRQQRQP